MSKDDSFDLSGARIWVAGHNGMVGSALVRRLRAEKCEILTVDRNSIDLRRQSETEKWLSDNRPDVVILAAAKVGGILANKSYPAAFLYENLVIETNVIEASRSSNVKKLILLGSSCIYPKYAPQPIHEEALLSGPLEPTNEWYAIAKIAGIKLVQSYRLQYDCNFISAMPSNLYGPGDNFGLASSHVLPALIRKFHEAKLSGAKQVVVWGTGTPRREFLHVDDCADAVVFLLQHYDGLDHLNIGYGSDISILELAKIVACTIGYDGAIVLDKTKPDGTPQKLMNSHRINNLGWSPRISLSEGIGSTYDWFLENFDRLRSI